MSALQPTRLARRSFLKTAALAGAGAMSGAPLKAKSADTPAEQRVRQLYRSLSPSQRGHLVFPWNDPRRTRVSNNWRVIEDDLGEAYTRAQQGLIDEVLRTAISPVGYDKLQRQMDDDYGGFRHYTCCLFHDPDTDRLAWVMAGRHVTLRVVEGGDPRLPFGGPVFYGHAVTFNERPDHPGNVWWHQARLANRLYAALDADQQRRALLPDSPPDSYDSIRLQGRGGRFTGLSLDSLNGEQQAILDRAAESLLELYRREDVELIRRLVQTNGDWKGCYLSFYREGNLGDDQVWDRWKLEGPNIVWYFRGSPHVHTWVHVGRPAV